MTEKRETRPRNERGFSLSLSLFEIYFTIRGEKHKNI